MPTVDDKAALRLNLGCGDRPRPGYTNIDIRPNAGIIAHDLRKGIPISDGSVEFVYHSTMLSHFKRQEAVAFMLECHRVLRSGGVLRVVTEDLEQLTRIYLQKLEEAWNGDRQSEHDHEWLMLELFDQAARERPGGEMAAYLMRPELPNEAFIRQRVGDQGAAMIAGARAQKARDRAPAPLSWKQRLRNGIRHKILVTVLGEGGDKAYDIGRFRLSGGSASHFSYDRYSLRELFRAAGFQAVTLQTPTTSLYADWDDVNMDVLPNGSVARPHTLIMEGMRS